MYGKDSHGFQVIEHHSDWSDKQAIETQYFPEVQRLITSHLDEVDEIKIFNWRVRGSSSSWSRSSITNSFLVKKKNRMYRDEGVQEVDLEDGSHYVLPASFVHIGRTIIPFPMLP